MRISVLTGVLAIVLLGIPWVSESMAQLAGERGTEEPRGIFRVWSSPSAAPGGQSFSDYEPLLRDEAREARAAYDQSDAPQLECRTSMPLAMYGATRLEFIQDGERIALRIQELSVERTIHIDPDGLDTAQPTSSSPLGHSIGYWDHGRLMVGTTHVDWPYFDGGGTPLSDGAEFIERFTFSEAENRLYYRLTTIDRGTFTGPVVLDRHWDWIPAGARMEPTECTH